MTPISELMIALTMILWVFSDGWNIQEGQETGTPAWIKNIDIAKTQLKIVLTKIEKQLNLMH
jgi:hypothetical protein